MNVSGDMTLAQFINIHVSVDLPPTQLCELSMEIAMLMLCDKDEVQYQDAAQGFECSIWV